MAITYAIGQRMTAELIQELADYTVNKPLVRLQQTAAQAMANNTVTAITFGASSTIIDTDGFHSETVSTSRVTPTVAGIYAVRGAVFVATFAAPVVLLASIGLNGSEVPAAARTTPPSVAAETRSTWVGPVMVECNGVTDYIELRGMQKSGAGQNTLVAAPQVSVFEVEYVRPA
jgi:hypothetical protein